jgi:predicted hotdog family 3-hydroxylacyl-ACP dehydratase
VTGVLTREGDTAIECQGCIPETSPFALNGRAPAFVAIELAAQAAAVLQALTVGLPGVSEAVGLPGVSKAVGSGGAARIGYLVGVREAHFMLPSVATGEILRVQVRVLRRAPPLAQFEATVSGSEGVVCRATLSTHCGAS